MNVFEIIAVISTILCVVLSGRQNILAWPSGIISVIALIVVYIKGGMYGQIVLQSIFLIQCIIGWYNWGKKDEVVITKRPKNGFILDILVFITVGIGFSLVSISINHEKNTLLTYVDGVGALIGLLGNKYLTKKVIQAWPLFMFYNILMIVLLLYQEIYLLVGLNLCLFCISFKSYSEWRKILTKG